MNYRPSFCIVNTVSKLLFRQVRILYLSKTTENKLRFQENVSVNSFTFDVRSGSCISQGLLKSFSHFNRTCQSTHSGSTLPIQNQLFLGKTKKPKKKHLLRHYAAKLQKDCFFVFPRKKMVLGRKTNFFLGQTKNTIFWETMRPNSKKIFLWFSLGKSWFFCPKPSFS